MPKFVKVGYHRLVLVQCPHCFAGPIAVEPDEFEFLCPVCTFRVRRLRQLPPRVRSRTSPAHLPFDRIGPFQILDALEYTPLGVRYKGFRVGESPEERQYLSIFVLSGLVSTDESLRARLDERCRLARRLSDTGFVRVVESGAENEMWYVATLSSSGSGLDDYLMNPAVTNEARLALVTTLVRSVTHAHQLGLVFGLMTPLSLFVEPNGLPKIHDFGLTHELLSDRRAAETLPVGAFTAAMAYLAPELRDFQQPPTSASDVYSLGVLLATVFCGRPISGMLRSLSQLQPAAPTALDPIVRRATAPEPDQRYAHAETLLSDLMQLDLDAPSQRIETRRSRAPQPEPSPALEIERERPLRPRPPIDWRIAVTLIALGALAFLLYRWITDRATPQTHIAPTADTNERRDVSEPNPDERTPTEDATTPTSTGL
ncbi:MAG: protein kinase, partial [Myxococcales bacterium]|nr:protein kinase [Myxococcales bacterium]